ncbi:hypothetical protein ACIGNX_02630 [Actinosynnema sp. NPDC053489]|uniref:hypothetical protein n=1 Tax=Actinosynnema sp. NPDC053489 TaxID=3363916 RepID=UPI0037C767D1
MHRTPSSRRGALFALVVTALLAAFLPAAASAQASAATAGIYLRDNLADTGAEPGSGGIWSSPDITVCAGGPCAADVPVTPTLTYSVWVNVHNNDQVAHTGKLRLYYTKAGGNAQWTADWTEFGNVTATIPPGGQQLMVPWTVPNDWKHYCLLARWVEDPADPMAFAEGLSTETNTRNNNNIAWHNVVTATHPANVDVRMDWMIGNPLPRDVRAGLVVAPVGEPFIGQGRVVVDLGQALTERWRAAGGQAVGLRQVGTTQFQVVDAKQARFTGLVLKAGERLPVGLVVNGTRDANGKPFTVFQTDEQGVDRGGVEYRLTFR